MKLPTRSLLILALSMIPATAPAQLWITNFETAGGGLASGVWRNNTAGTDTAIPVTLSWTNATLDDDTKLNGTQDWPDIFFNPNYVGDAVVLEVLGAATASVTIAFNASIVDPVLNFSDVDTQTTLMFNSPPTKVGGPDNLLIIGNSVKTTGDPIHFLVPDEIETLGSLMFPGTFTELSFTIVNDGSIPTEDEDRTGFSVSTTCKPVVVTPGNNLTIWMCGSDVYLSWPDTSTFSAIQYTSSLSAGPWMPLPGASPGTLTMWSASRASLGDKIFFRGVY